MKFHHTVFAHVREGWKKHGKKILIATGATSLVVIVIAGGSYGYVEAFEGQIYPNVTIGSVSVGGMTQAEASEAVQAAYNGMLDRGVPVRYNDMDPDRVNTVDRLSVIDLRASGSTDLDLVYDLIDMNVDKATSNAIKIGRDEESAFLNTWNALLTLVAGETVNIETTINKEQIEEAVLEEFAEYEQLGEKTDYEIEIDGDEVTVEVLEGTTGFTLNTEKVYEAIRNSVQQFQIDEITIGLIEMPIVSVEEAEQLTEEVKRTVLAAPYTLTHTSDSQREYEWTATEDDVAEWIYPKMTADNIEIALAAEDMEEFLTEIHEDVDVDAQNARFQMEDGKVVEFKGSLNGETLDEEATINSFNNLLGEEESSFPIAVVTVEPEVTTESVNNLGITEIIGVGVSDFSGSPANRRSNIQHGSDKLNGLLIAPGEEFSLVDALSPFTISDGWLPELVIKGDEIKPEVGGGACQFGTTLFRAAMNSGLEITQRRNHSLVVSYYNDPSNGNPGTDATIYDPAPDFRFKNDFENYILLTTDVDMETGQMTFTFWGTSDGRVGYYTPPEVLSWTGYGATQYTETDSLPPGVQRCQAPHSGAVTSFDYIVEYEDGETFEHTYTSTYRSLPRVCLVGIGGESGEESETPPGADSAPDEEPLEVNDVPVEEPIEEPEG